MDSETKALPETEVAEPTSLPGRLFNVFAAPAEVFEELRASRPAHSNWLAPMLLSMIVGIAFSLIVFSQPDIVAQVFKPQEDALAAQVEAGKMSQTQADNTLEAMHRFSNPRIMMLMGAVGAVFGSAFFLAVMSLTLWVLTAKILKGDISIFKAFEMTGLAGVINLLGGLVTMMIVLLKGNVAAGPNAALVLTSFDQSSYVHQYLGAINVMTIWYLIVLSIAVAKLSGRTCTLAACWIIGFWAILRFGLATLSAWWVQFQSSI